MHNRGHDLLRPQRWVLGMYHAASKLAFHIDLGLETLPVDPPYIHQTVNHSLFFRDPITGAHTNNVEAYWASVKKSFKRGGQTSTNLLQQKKRPVLDKFTLIGVSKKWTFSDRTININIGRLQHLRKHVQNKFSRLCSIPHNKREIDEQEPEQTSPERFVEKLTTSIKNLLVALVDISVDQLVKRVREMYLAPTEPNLATKLLRTFSTDYQRNNFVTNAVGIIIQENEMRWQYARLPLTRANKQYLLELKHKRLARKKGLYYIRSAGSVFKVPIEECDKPKTTFSTGIGIYEFKTLPLSVHMPWQPVNGFSVQS
ncbi:hypothetical protein RF11_01899 [Thelohanellus kitauei]|uniref:Uncharacterized protein n=1 Tax=Thelohanellus kitauei TaxID=669202 RepID=A0A0C2JBV5_THEKT|nr:hypothetical protein RF11_01899 [Thelohanellus kitauei]